MASVHTDKKRYGCMVPTLTSINLTNTHIYGIPVLGHPLTADTYTQDVFPKCVGIPM